ncbi:T9SS type A sorting domain-containing protein, partial [candidate division WOR-3 bacterium]|nr:T9SS type A sorting domain-containing protein [candidate division WOR-3 bacterium]
GTFTTGMSFSYTQEGTEYNDYGNAIGTGYIIFNDGSYHVAFANDAGTYRTVGSSFQLGRLVDATPPSTRSALLDSIMKFFGIVLNPGVEERPQHESAQNSEFISVFPNPCTHKLALSYSIHASMDVRLSVYDATGRQIATLVEQILPAGVHTATWHVSDNQGRSVPAGIYFMKLEAGTKYDIQKIVVLN